ncbi:sugar isomerase domain-containing protein [Kurthia senegalensis]|uniref:sugar isomerase domain-containing protein n=1 Tax=Kurthia senegalensis TaxID=1033740 RepID=UPI000288B144|nr:SIS domain-containing protein [Kurthia senegalensis]
MHNYFLEVEKLLHTVGEQQSETISDLAEVIASKIQRGGIIQLFGSGHSMLLAQDGYFRGGGLVPIKPVQVESLMLHRGALSASSKEKEQGYFEHIQEAFAFNEQDVCIIISTSAKNPVPIDAALYAKAQGVVTVSLQSLAYQHVSSKHVSGKRLEQVVDVVLDTMVPIGDGVLQLDELQYGPVSTIVGAAILNDLYAQIIEKLHKAGQTLPVFRNSNLGATNNDELIANYGKRINF